MLLISLGATTLVLILLLIGSQHSQINLWKQLRNNHDEIDRYAAAMRRAPATEDWSYTCQFCREEVRDSVADDEDRDLHAHDCMWVEAQEEGTDD